MKKSIFLLLCISVLFSCTKKEDFFDPHHIDEEAKENFPVKDIDPSQDWNMAAVGFYQSKDRRGLYCESIYG